MIRETLVRYRVTWFGILWSLLPTLALLSALSLVFTDAYRAATGEAPYYLFTLAGLVPWTFTTGAISRASTSLVGNVELVTRVYIPREIFPIAAMGSRVVDFVLGLSVYFLLALFAGHFHAASLVYLPVVVLVHFVLLFGVSLLVAAFTIPIRDISFAMNYLTLIGLFLTPVCFPLQSLSPRKRMLLHLNPMTPIIEGYRDVLLRGSAPWSFSFFGVTLASIVLTLLAYQVFRRVEARFVEIL